MAKKVLTTPIKAGDLGDIHIGDIIYLPGHITTYRGVAHRRLVEGGRKLLVDLGGGAILHAGPIVRPLEDERYKMVLVEPTTSVRMEKFGREFIRETGMCLVMGGGGMGVGAEEGCKEYKALHRVFPAGCVVVAADGVEEVEQTQWLDLGMPKTLWTCRAKEFGPLIVPTDMYRRNLFEQNKVKFNEKKNKVYERICRGIRFIKQRESKENHGTYTVERNIPISYIVRR